MALVIGANDVVNPAARTDKSPPPFGMPILDVDKARQVYVVKRGQGKGYAAMVTALLYDDNCNMVYGDAAAVLTKMIEAVRMLGTKVAARAKADLTASAGQQQEKTYGSQNAGCRR